VANHFWLDFHLIEFFARVDSNDASNHFWYNNHVTKVSLDKIGLLVRLGLRFGLAELLDETHGLALQATVEPPTGTGMDNIAKLFGGEIEELIEINAAEAELAEGSLLLEFSSLFSVVIGVSHDE